MLLCLFLCALPLALPAIVHGAMVAALTFGIGAGTPDVVTFAPYSAPVAPVTVAPYSALDRPSIRMPSPPCRAVVARVEPRAYPVPVIRAPRSDSGRFGRVVYSNTNESYTLSLTVLG